MNIEGGGGVSQGDFGTISAAMGVIGQAYGVSRDKGFFSKTSKTKGDRKLDALDLGDGVVASNLFQPVVNSVKGTLTGIQGGDVENMNTQCANLWRNRELWIKVIKSAKFDTNRVGLD
jgi:hypothetical protein